MKKVGIIGVGKMGGGICERLLGQDYRVILYNTSIEKVIRFQDRADNAESATALINRCEFILLSLPSSKQVEETLNGLDGINLHNKKFIDLSTSHPLSTRKLHNQLSALGAILVDAPIIGGPRDATEGRLVAIAGGDEAAIDSCMDVLHSFCNKVIRVGAAGSGHFVKLLMNFIALGYVALYSQAFSIAEQYDINTDLLDSVIQNSNSNCSVYQFYAPKIKDKNYRLDFSMGFAAKDFAYLKNLYEETNTPAFLLDEMLNIVRIGIKDGRKNADFSESAQVLRDFFQQRTKSGSMFGGEQRTNV